VRIIAAFLLFISAGAVIACGGDSTDVNVLATAAADTEPSSSFNVVAKGTKFDTDTLVAVADEEVVISFENHDSALHNIAVLTEKGGDTIFRGELFTGTDTREYRFQAPSPGVYYFRCDAHPEMNGVFIAK
jgi:plastocyanin